MKLTVTRDIAFLAMSHANPRLTNPYTFIIAGCVLTWATQYVVPHPHLTQASQIFYTYQLEWLHQQGITVNTQRRAFHSKAREWRWAFIMPHLAERVSDEHEATDIA
jgi:hypothetical protein